MTWDHRGGVWGWPGGYSKLHSGCFPDGSSKLETTSLREEKRFYFCFLLPAPRFIFP